MPDSVDADVFARHPRPWRRACRPNAHMILDARGEHATNVANAGVAALIVAAVNAYEPPPVLGTCRAASTPHPKHKCDSNDWTPTSEPPEPLGLCSGPDFMEYARPRTPACVNWRT